ncbi:hypothetical protein JJ685_24505 [Ramlibacter monticola]|uniref:Uncharacterized protein n=1 Tax=Ramlibacter monticola TaxID=1926872 RepID=A0A937CWA9_9BURK|nr:hypothetical protein [Ramlibacter monticola]MBL0394324.1 hypothetical protein [Ramlibacter monticola]
MHNDTAPLTKAQQHDALYWEAFIGLHAEFLRVLADSPAETLACPHEGPELALARVVSELVLAQEGDHHTLAELLRVAHGAAARGDARAQGVVEHLANTYAAHFAAAMDEAGDFANTPVGACE